MDQTARNSIPSGGVQDHPPEAAPVLRASPPPAVVSRHLPATVALGVVFVLGGASSVADERLLRQSLADETGRAGLIGVVAPEIFPPDGGTAPGSQAAGLGQAIIGATDRLSADWRYRGLPVGYLALHDWVGAALVAASLRPEVVRAVVGACGNPLDAGAALAAVRAPTLFIVDEVDAACVDTHRRAQHGLYVTNALKTIPDCRHVLDIAAVRHAAASMARDWFAGFLTGQRA
jgi:putative phosphoribosyl transferase